MIIIILLAAILIVGGVCSWLIDEYGWKPWKVITSAAIVLLSSIGALLVISPSVFVLDDTQDTYVDVKYRDDRVDIGAGNFASLDKSDTVVKNAWYDDAEGYLIITLNDTSYHYCEVPNTIWDSLKSTDSLYSYYQSALRGNYDCRVNHTPSY